VCCTCQTPTVADMYPEARVVGSDVRWGAQISTYFSPCILRIPVFRIHLARYSWSNGNYETQIGERGWMCPGDLRKDELGTLRYLYSAGEEMRRRARGMISC